MSYDTKVGSQDLRNDTFSVTTSKQSFVYGRPYRHGKHRTTTGKERSVIHLDFPTNTMWSWVECNGGVGGRSGPCREECGTKGADRSSRVSRSPYLGRVDLPFLRWTDYGNLRPFPSIGFVSGPRGLPMSDPTE